MIGFDAGDQVRQPGRPPSGVVAPQSTPADLAINSDATTTLPDIGTSGATEVEISGQARTSSADVEQLRRQIEALVREKNEVLERNAALESENQSLSELASSMTTFMTPVASSSSGIPTIGQARAHQRRRCGRKGGPWHSATMATTTSGRWGVRHRLAPATFSFWTRRGHPKSALGRKGGKPRSAGGLDRRSGQHVYHTPEAPGNARPSVGGEPPWAGMRAETEVFVESDE